MNIVEAFLAQHNIGPRHSAEPLYSLTLTPRFPASRHVVFLLMTREHSDPVMVAKVPRLIEVSDSVEREVRNLREIQGLRPQGYDSIPRVLAFETFRGYPILVETALVGQLLSPDVVRRNQELYSESVIDWLADLHQVSSPTDTWFEQIAEPPLNYLEQHLSEDERPLLDALRVILQPLHDAPLPLVLEHGDLSHPNLILIKSGGIGVVDWELSEVKGMIASDLFFFLSYIAFSLSHANDTGEYLPAFETAFFQPQTWATRHMQRYFKRVPVPPALLTPLFALCWTRYLVNLLKRLRIDDVSPVQAETLAQLRENRYFAIWRYTIQHIHEFTFSVSSG